MDPGQIIERERRWARPAAILTLLAVGLFAVSLVILATDYSADGNAELLRKIDRDSGTFMLAYVIRALGAALLVVPLLYLFQAALARSDRMRGQLVGLAIAGPLFLAGLAIFTGLSLKDAAPDFVDMPNVGTGERADDAAQNVIEDAAMRDIAAGFGFAGALGFAFSMAYSSFHAMRVGLLSRFWGSLGTALGVASILLFQYTLLWIAYLGLLIGGWVPRGRPPAWEEGKAVPWPTPGQETAEAMRGDENAVDEGGSGERAAGEHTPPDRDEGEPERGERRKRKRRR